MKIIILIFLLLIPLANAEIYLNSPSEWQPENSYYVYLDFHINSSYYDPLNISISYNEPYFITKKIEQITTGKYKAEIYMLKDTPYNSYKAVITAGSESVQLNITMKKDSVIIKNATNKTKEPYQIPKPKEPLSQQDKIFYIIIGMIIIVIILGFALVGDILRKDKV